MKSVLAYVGEGRVAGGIVRCLNTVFKDVGLGWRRGGVLSQKIITFMKRLRGNFLARDSALRGITALREGGG